MRFISYIAPNSNQWAPRVGVLLPGGQEFIDLVQVAERDGGSFPWATDVIEITATGDPALEEIRKWIGWAKRDKTASYIYRLADVKLLSPVPLPTSLRVCTSFEQHLVQCTRTAVKWKFPPAALLDRYCEKWFGTGFLRPPSVWSRQPLYYKGNPQSVVGSGTDVIWPSFATRLDFELEFGIFISRRAKNISREDASKYIAGYALFNDFSARNTQLREMTGRLGPAKGKDFDTGNAIGPYLVTPDEIDDYRHLKMRVLVNDEVWSETDAAEMHFSPGEIIEHISRDETLWPGDFIGFGTLPNGCGLELDRWIKIDDTVKIECDKLGTLTNRIVSSV